MLASQALYQLSYNNIEKLVMENYQFNLSYSTFPNFKNHSADLALFGYVLSSLQSKSVSLELNSEMSSRMPEVCHINLNGTVAYSLLH